jgi:hypothetical protein
MPTLNFMKNFEQHFPVRIGVSDASLKVAMIYNTTIASLTDDQKATLQAVYNNSGCIVVIEPEYEDVNTLSEILGHVHVMSDDNPLHWYDIYAFDNRDNHYVLGNLHPAGKTEDLDKFDSGAYIKVINAFVEWIIKDLTNNATPLRMQATAAASQPDPTTLFGVQTVTHTFSAAISGRVCKVTASDPDNLGMSGTITVVTQVTPMHAFDDQAGHGDYYIMHQEITIPNGQWYNGTWSHKHGGVNARMCAWYMSNFQLATYENSNTSTILQAKPETTVGNTSYTSGMSWNIGGSFTGGTQNGDPLATASISGGVSFSNSQTRSISDVDVKYMGDGGHSAIWGLVFNNLASYNWNMSINEPALPSRSTQMLYSDWIWYFPNINDNATSGTHLQISMYLDGTQWNGAYFYSSDADFHDDVHPTNKDIPYSGNINFSAPNRTPTGQIAVKDQTTSNYITDVRIWKSTTLTSSAPDYMLLPSGTSIAPGDSGSGWLPVGSYNVQLQIQGAYYHSKTPVSITRAGTSNLNAASTSPDFVAGAF